ncbi:unnamed protein product [Discosporangium mesarthrocarpum]
MDRKLDAVSRIAQQHYDSHNSYNFYKQVWGGDHIHIGLYSKLKGAEIELKGVERIKRASALSTETLLSHCFSKERQYVQDGGMIEMMDLGSGYGGTARMAALAHGCHVTCINVSSKENATNAAMTAKAGLSNLVHIPGEKTFFQTGEPDASFEVVISQDALLHAGTERHLAVVEAARVLKPGGLLCFADIMQAETAKSEELQEVYDRLHLDNLATPQFYLETAEKNGLELESYTPYTSDLVQHYSAVRDVLLAERAGLEGVQQSYVDNMARGLNAWIEAGRRNNLRWGCFVFKKTAQHREGHTATETSNRQH